MRETLATTAVLVRFGWRSTLGALLFKQQSMAMRMLTLFSFGYMPFLYFFNSHGTLQRLGDRERLTQFLVEWKLPSAVLLEESSIWPGQPHLVGLGICVMFCAIFLGGIFAVHVIARPKEADSELEWMANFPIRTRSVLWGRLVKSTVVQPYLLLIVLPFLLSFVFVRGQNLAFSCVSFLLLGWIGMLAASSLGMVFNYFVSFRLSPARQRDIRVLVIVLGAALFFLVYFPFIMNEGVYWRTIYQLLPGAHTSGISPFITSLLSGETSSLAPLSALLGVALVLAQSSVVISERIVTQGSPPQERAQSKEWRFFAHVLDRLNPIVRSDIRVLLRDRSQWAGFIVGPIFFLGSMIWGSLSSDSPSYGNSVLIVCIVMYVMLVGFGLQGILQRERSTLWFYAVTPVRLSEVLQQKRKVPFAFFGLIFAAVFAGFISMPLGQDAAVMSRFALGLHFAFTSIRHFQSAALTTYTPEENLAGKPLQLMIWYSLTPVFTLLVFEGDPWNVAAFLIPFTALASIYRKKVLALEDDLIDPSYRITPSADLSQGFTAALLYTFALMTVNALARFFDINLSVQFLAAAVTLWTLHYYYATRDVQDVPEYFGPARILDLLFLGLMGTFIIRAAGLWDRLTNGSAFLEHMYELRDYPPAPVAGVMLFVIIARSLTEELIFRGLIQRGLSTRMVWPLALIASAGLTTLSHKPQDFGPIFLTSLGSGILYHRTKVLWPGILLAIVVQSLRLFAS